MTATKIPSSSQFHFFLMPEETRLVLKFISEEGCAIYPTRLDSPEPKECDELCDLGQMFFCPRELRPQIKTWRIAEGLYSIDRTTSPVIEFDHSHLRSDSLSRGRLYYQGGYDGREQWVAYPESLYIIYKKVTSFMKKSLLTKDREYLGYISKGSVKYISEGRSSCSVLIHRPNQPVARRPARKNRAKRVNRAPRCARK